MSAPLVECYDVAGEVLPGHQTLERVDLGVDLPHASLQGFAVDASGGVAGVPELDVHLKSRLLSFS